jgi:class 3 adenylate cyclase
MAIRKPFHELDKHNTIRNGYTGVPLSTDYCTFFATMYPSDEMKEQFASSNPIIFASLTVLIFVFTTLVFSFYDSQVEQRQRLVMTTAIRTTDVLSSLFPSKVRDQLLWEDSSNNGVDAGDDTKHTTKSGSGSGSVGFGDVPFGLNSANKNSLTSGTSTFKQRFASPIADLYPDTTVFFADICGFTAWSSLRGPDHVFILLESLYSEFDKIARRRRVFKVETIGDSYVAVGGLPDPMKYHATVMVKFSEDILRAMKLVVNELSTSFGPDTLDLELRVGLNSGPTTAGVIRGEKSRFQLFGDTVNTASRMESTGLPGKIQCSLKTAELLRANGKGHWVSQREDVVRVKGKGDMITFWVQSSPMVPGSIQSEHSVTENNHDGVLSFGSALQNDERLIDWNVDVFTTLLIDIVSVRVSGDNQSIPSKEDCCNRELKTFYENTNTLPFDEIVDVLDLSPSTLTNNSQQQQTKIMSKVQLEPNVTIQLREYVSAVAASYRRNPFHNFEHASHVVMSAKHLLDRITTVTSNNNSQYIHLDPLVRIAIVFGALIHDVDHSGVPNFQLTKERTSSALLYKDRCIAEQNSFDVAWRLFMQPQYSALHQCMFDCESEWKRFRQVVLNVVMATDIFDKDLKVLRQNRWDVVFGEESTRFDSTKDTKNDHDRLATICVEHLIQASDVIHTMQHWHIYQKWNHKLFQEMNIAYQQGRLEKNPCLTWYEGELLFFDNYIIPLAKKLKECGVFGANSAAFLDFANDNRVEWESKGRTIVHTWIEELKIQQS